MSAVSVMNSPKATDTESVFSEVCSLLNKFRKNDAPITVDTDISRDLNMDSLAVMDLMMELEDKFDVSIPLNLVPEITTVGQLAQTIINTKEA